MASDKKNLGSGTDAVSSSLHPGRDPNDPIFELDLQQEPLGPDGGGIDELEFDPVVESRRSSWEQDETATELDLPSSMPPGVVEPLLTLEEELVPAPLPSLEDRQGSPQSELPAPSTTVASIPDLATPDGSLPTRKASSSRFGPSGDAHRTAAAGLPGVPDLEVAAPKKKPSPSRNEQRRSQNPPPPLDLDYGSAPHPAERTPANRRSSIPPARSSVPAGRSSAYPGGLGSPSSPSGAPSVQHWGGLTGEHELGGLDDFDLTAASRAAQLDVAVALPSPDDDQPWPLGRTPFEDELEVSLDAVAREGYGRPPSDWTGTPVYALRLWHRRGSVENRTRAAQASLRDQEHRRDQRLSVLAEQMRGAIGEQERFAPLFAQVDHLSQELETSTRELESMDRSSAHEMHAIERELEDKKALRLRAEAERDEVRRVHDEHERQIERLRAAQKRVAIEERNLDDRLETGGISGPEYELQSAEVHNRLQTLEHQEAQELRQLAVTEARLVEKENGLRVALAEQQNKEGALETHLIAIEGENALRSERLMEARRARQQLLADVGRAIVELRGAVSVDVSTRRELVELDNQVHEAARRVQLMNLVEKTVDRRAQKWGLTLWGVLVLLVFGGLIYLLNP